MTTSRLKNIPVTAATELGELSRPWNKIAISSNRLFIPPQFSDEELRFLNESFDIAESHTGHPNEWSPLTIDEEGVRLGEPSNQSEAVEKIPVSGGISVPIPSSARRVPAEPQKVARRPQGSR